MIMVDVYTDREVSHVSSDELVEAGHFYISRLMPNLQNLEVTIDIQSSLDNFATGYCLQDAPREFIIELKLDTLDCMLMTLAHELVHVRQFIQKKELCEDEAYELEGILFEQYMKERGKCGTRD